MWTVSSGTIGSGFHSRQLAPTSASWVLVDLIRELTRANETALDEMLNVLSRFRVQLRFIESVAERDRVSRNHGRNIFK